MPNATSEEVIAGLRKDVDRLGAVVDKIIDFLPEPSDEKLLEDAGWTIVSRDPFEISLGCTLRWGGSAKAEVNTLRAAYREKRKEAFGL